MSNFNEHGIKCPVDWDAVPKPLDWVAIDETGEVYAYQLKPTFQQDVLGFWENPHFIEGVAVTSSMQSLGVFDISHEVYLNEAHLCLWQRPKQ